ncbi:MAG: hypothetical protein ACF8QF_11955 [Phycisphaerales bacterium]
MPSDLTKRNRLLRKHCPEYFGDETPAVHGKVVMEDGSEIGAVLFAFDDDDRLTDAMITTRDKMMELPTDDPGVIATMRMLRDEPMQTDTVILDMPAICRAAGEDIESSVRGAMIWGFADLRGMTTDEIAEELLNRSSHRPQRVDTLSLDEFFDGNGDDWSIAPNKVGHGHPGIDVFRRVLFAIRERPEVVDVRIGVHEWPHPDEDDWIAAEQIFFWTRGVTADDILAWIQPLDPEGVSELGDLFRIRGGREPEPGVEVFWTTWD